MARERGCKFSKSQTKTEREEKGDTTEERRGLPVSLRIAFQRSGPSLRSHQKSFTFFLGTAGHRDELGFKEGSVAFTLQDLVKLNLLLLSYLVLEILTTLISSAGNGKKKRTESFQNLGQKLEEGGYDGR